MEIWSKWFPWTFELGPRSKHRQRSYSAKWKKRSVLFFSPLVGPALTATEQKSKAKEKNVQIYSVSAVENYLSKIFD